MSRILVIDDDEAMRDVIADILGGEGHQVSSAENGADGLAQAAATHPDLILCDIIMPAMSGYAVLSALRREPSTAVTPVIFLTGMGEPEALRAGMNLGADDYLVKPVQLKVLITAVAARLERSAAVRSDAERRLHELRDELARSLLPHEFLTPLTAVLGLASLLEEGAVPARDIKEVGRGILDAGQMLEGLIEKFLAYAELHASGPDIGLGLVGDKALEIARAEATHRALRANRAEDLDVWGESVHVPMPLDHWRLLVRELVDNAFKFSRAGSLVALGLTIRDGAPTLTVRDRGLGMSTEQREGLDRRAPYLRRHQDQAGLGLGLSIVRRLLQLYGGGLAFETAAGEGTTVRVRFG